MEAYFRDPSTLLTEAQRDLRALILKQAENEPASFDMTTWEDYAETAGETACGTTRCIGGWSDFFTYGKFIDDGRVGGRSIVNLGLTGDEYFGERDEEGYGVPLFHASNYDALVRLNRLVHNPDERP